MGAIDHVPNGPVVNVAAFSRQGRLAFVSHETLWLLDGDKGALRRLPLPSGYFVPQEPLFSEADLVAAGSG